MNKSIECFVVMPFSTTVHGTGIETTTPEWDHIYEKWIKRAVESHKSEMKCKRSPALPGNFVKGIVADLQDTFLVVADLTGNKPNVFYELGIRHALRVGTILITRDIHAVPSDLRSYHAFQYNYTNKAHEYDSRFAEFEKEMHAKMDWFLSLKVQGDSPVSDYLGYRKAEYEKQFDREKAVLRRLLNECRNSLTTHQEFASFLIAAFKHKGKKLPTLSKMPVFETLQLDALYHRVLSIETEVLPRDTYDILTSTILHTRSMVTLAAQAWNDFRLMGSQESAESLLNVLKPLADAKAADVKIWDAIITGLDEVVKLKVGFSDTASDKATKAIRNSGNARKAKRRGGIRRS